MLRQSGTWGHQPRSHHQARLALAGGAALRGSAALGEQRGSTHHLFYPHNLLNSFLSELETPPSSYKPDSEGISKEDSIEIDLEVLAG